MTDPEPLFTLMPPAPPAKPKRTDAVRRAERRAEDAERARGIVQARLFVCVAERDVAFLADPLEGWTLPGVLDTLKARFYAGDDAERLDIAVFQACKLVGAMRAGRHGDPVVTTWDDDS